MKNILAIVGIIFLIVAVAAVGVLGYYSKGFKDWSFIQQSATAPGDSTDSGGSTMPGGSTTPGGNTTPGGSTTPGGNTGSGGSTEDPAACTHDFWTHKQSAPFNVVFMSRLGAGYAMPEGFDEFYGGYKLEWTDGGNKIVVYMFLREADFSASKNNYYFVAENGNILGYVEDLSMSEDNRNEINIRVTTTIKITGICDEGIAQGTFQTFSVMYAVASNTCSKCGAKA